MGNFEETSTYFRKIEHKGIISHSIQDGNQ